MGIIQVELTASEEKEIVDAEDMEITEEEGLLGPPQPVKMDDHIEYQVDVSDKGSSPPLIPAPYPKASGALSYVTAPTPNHLTQELKSLQSSNIHVAYINRQKKTRSSPC
jgi:hypothetical protein